jgi:hypothetical protein
MNLKRGAVHPCNRHLEHRVYICRSIDWQTTFPWEECGPSAGFDDRHAGEPITRDRSEGRMSNLLAGF